jgi:6-phosphogluconate dehydrogenase (decarboxylating)
MDNIKIVRLQNGEDIVGFVTDKVNGDIDIADPMAVGIEFQGNQSGLVMRHWLPVQLVKENSALLHDKDILCVFTPAEDFCEYYLNTITKLKQLLQARDIVDDMTDEELEEAIQEIEEMNQNGYTLH